MWQCEKLKYQTPALLYIYQVCNFLQDLLSCKETESCFFNLFLCTIYYRYSLFFIEGGVYAKKYI